MKILNKKLQLGGPAPKDKDKQPVDLTLVESPPPGMSPVGGPFDMEAFNELSQKLDPSIKENIDYFLQKAGLIETTTQYVFNSNPDQASS